jgi:hypothetical protein
MEWPLLAPSRRWGQFRSASWGVKRTSRLGAQVVSLIDPGTLPAPDYSGLEVADGFNSGRVLKAFEAAKTLLEFWKSNRTFFDQLYPDA